MAYIPHVVPNQRYRATTKSNGESILVVAEDLNAVIDQLNIIISGSGTPNIRTVAYTVGVYGVTGVDYNFTSVADHVKQSIQLGATTIIPKNSRPFHVAVKCTLGISGAATGVVNLGLTSGSNEYMIGTGTGLIDDTDEIYTNITPSMTLGTTYSAATSVYFSFDPDTNWDTITSGTWKIHITYIDNSIL